MLRHCSEGVVWRLEMALLVGDPIQHLMIKLLGLPWFPIFFSRYDARARTTPPSATTTNNNEQQRTQYRLSFLIDLLRLS